MELVKNVKTHGNNEQNGWTRKQQQTTTLSEPRSVDIDAIDTDMHARPAEAELIPWLLVLDCAPQLSFCARHRCRVLSGWWFAAFYDTDCLQPLMQLMAARQPLVQLVQLVQLVRYTLAYTDRQA